MNKYFEEAKIIYLKMDKSFNSYFNSIILNYILDQKNPYKIFEVLNIFKDTIDFNLFNLEQKKTLAHYICLYLSDNSHLNTFTQIFSFIKKLKIDFSLKVNMIEIVYFIYFYILMIKRKLFILFIN